MGQALDDSMDPRLSAWIETNLSCTITAFERQRRWRPAWYAEITTIAGDRRSLYIRTDRPEAETDEAFLREYRVLRVLESAGIPIPHSYGLCPEPLAIVQERAPGRPDLSTADSDAERASVLNQYMEVLARIHQLDPSRFDGTGLAFPDGPYEIAVGHFDTFVDKYRSAKRRPEPINEFLIGWIHRNVPRHRDRVSFLVGDVAQFLFDAGELTVVLDLELACLGDPLHDLAAFQIRNTTEPLGDFAHALQYYEEITREPIDADVFDFHAVVFATITPLAMSSHAFASLPTSSVLQYLEWFVHGCRWPLEIIAEKSDVELPEPPAVVPEPMRYDPLAESLVGALEAMPAGDEFEVYERAAMANLAAFVARAGQCGPPVARQDKAEVEAFLGARFDTLEAADAALEDRIVAAGPEEDARLLPLLYARVQRHCELFRPFLSRPSLANRIMTFEQLVAGVGR